MHPILIVSPTEPECLPTLQKTCDLKILSPYLYSGTLHGHSIELLISGIGIVSTTFRLTQTLMHRCYSRAISIGIAGSFSKDVDICETVQISQDCFADLGIDDNGQFRNLREMGLTCDDFDCGFITNPSPTLSSHRTLRGITVQTTSGSAKRINELALYFDPDVETMENAAFFYVCRKINLPFASFRAISNKVEPRNRENWRTAEAISNVNETLLISIINYQL